MPSVLLGQLAGPLGAAYLTTVFLLSLRVAAVFFLTPIFYSLPVPARSRILLVAALAVALAAGLAPPTVAAAPVEWSHVLSAASAEIMLGATLGLGILLAFGAFSVAGNLLDLQIGFGIAQVFDPTTQRQVPILTSLFDKVAVLVFFLVNGHHALLRGIAYSLERFPLGAPWSASVAVAPVLKAAGALFSLGFALAAPVVFCLLLVELALGVVARNLPQMNLFALGVPVKIVVGLAALSLWFLGIGGVMTRVYASIAQTWDQVFVATVPPELVR